MKRRPLKPGIRISFPALLLLACIALLSLLWVMQSQKKHPHPARPAMIAAADKVMQCQTVLRERLDIMGLPVDWERDPLRSGLIGSEFTPLTTTLGELPAKQMSTSPDFAALFIHWFSELALQQGDRVVILASASFPALILSAISAAEEWGLKIQLFTSAGASSFGANRPDWTWWDMERYLFDKGLIRTRTALATPGGTDDNGSSFWPGGMEGSRAAAQRNGLDLFIPEHFQQALRVKLNKVTAVRLPALFINIGGNETGVGRPPCSLSLNTGLIQDRLPEKDCDGLIQIMSRMDIPVLHILQIRDLAAQYGLGGDIDSFRDIGLSDIYNQKQNDRTVLLITAMLVGLSWAAFYFIRRIRYSRPA